MDADGPQQLFESIYSERIEAVSKTINRDDDVKLAAEILKVGQGGGNPPQVQGLIYRTVFDLGCLDADGYKLAVEAMNRLASVPGARDEAREKMLDVLTRQYRNGKTDEREGAARQLFDLYIDFGNDQMNAKKWTEATSHFRLAVALASKHRWSARDGAMARMQLSLKRGRAERNLDAMNVRLLKNAGDTATAEQLVRLHVVDFDDPASALPYLDRVKDGEMKRLVPLAAKPHTQVNEAACLELGIWYKELSGPIPSHGDLPIVNRAIRYLDRYLDLHQTNDLNRNRASIVLEKARAIKLKLAPSSRFDVPTEWKFIRELSHKLFESTDKNIPSELAVEIKRGVARIHGKCKHDAGHFFGILSGHFGKAVLIPRKRTEGTLRVAEPHRGDHTYYQVLIRKKGKPTAMHILELDAAGAYMWKLESLENQFRLTAARGNAWLLDVKIPKDEFIDMGFAATVRWPNQSHADITITWK